MKRIIITESQYRRLFREQYEKLEDDYNENDIKDSFKLDSIPVEMGRDSSEVAALNIPVKPTASGESKRKLTDVFTSEFLKNEKNIQSLYELGITSDGINMNELLSGFDINQVDIDQFDDNLVPALKKIIDDSGVSVKEITGGKDKYHLTASPNSNHNKGKAIDFTISSGTDEDQMKIEKAAIDLIINGDYTNLQLINEYKHKTGAGTGNHFHLVINGKSDLNWYHFIDKDTLEAKVDNKKPLVFNGTGEYVFKKWFEILKTKNVVPIEKVKSKPISPIVGDPLIDKLKPVESNILSKDEIKKTVDYYRNKKKSEIKKGINLYKNFLNGLSDEKLKKYYTNIINGLNNLLNEV